MFRVLTVLFLFIFTLPPASAQTPCADDERPISHALGETCVPEDAGRVVALEWTYAEDLLALGMQPVGMADIQGYQDWVQLPVELSGDVADVGTRQEPSLEQIAALKPDLILAIAFRVGESYEQLSAIAPTLVFDPFVNDAAFSQYEEMRGTFTTIARAVGREAEGEAVLGRLDAKLEAAAEGLAQAGKAGAPFMLAQAYSAGDGLAEIRMFTDNALATQIIEQLGLKNAWQGGFEVYGYATIGIEGLRGVADVDFFYVVNDTDDVFASGAAAPLWRSLQFVKVGRAHPLGGTPWLFGGPLSAELLLDNVSASLLGKAE